MLFGGVGGASATSLARIATTTTIAVSPASADSSATITFSATVAAASGAAPSGSVEFDAHFTAVGGTTGRDIVIGTQTLTPGSGSQSAATLTVTGLQAGAYSVTGSYNPPAGSLTWSGSTSSPATPLSIGVAIPSTVNMTFSLSSTTINAGESVTFSTKVTGQPGLPAPTGVVVFSAGPDVNDQDVLKSVQLASDGTATATIGGWSGGTYIVAASYQGDPIYVSPSQDLSLTVNAVSEAVQTTTSVTLQPSTIAAGSMLTVQIHVQQQGNPLPPPSGDVVALSAGVWGGNPAAAVPIPREQAIPLDANGNATVTVGGWSGGDFAVYAAFVGDVFDLSSSGVAHLTVTSPTNVDSISYTGATQASFGSQATLAGQLVDGNGAPISGEQVTLSIDGPGGTSCSATTDASGNASCPVNVQGQPGIGAVTAAFFGDATYQAASADAQFAVLPVSTTLSYTGDTTGGTGAQATLAAQLVRADSTPIAGELVMLTMGAETCTATTDATGRASCQVTVSEGMGSYPIGATFAGDGGYSASSAAGVFDVTAQSTTTSTGNVTALAGSTTTFSATLTSASNPVSGKTITIAAGAQSCSGTTDSTGTASCSIALSQAVGTYTITASFAANGGYLGSSGTGALTIQKIPTTTAYTGATQAEQGSTVTLSAQVTAVPNGAPVAFTVGAESCNGAVAGGVASCQVTPTDTPGSNYTVTATYAGDATHAASSGSAPFTVISPVTTTHIASVAPVLAGSSVTLSATVAPSTAPGTVTFSSAGSILCTATLSSGAASCAATFPQSGTYTVTAKYGGTDVYRPSSDSTSVLVYAFAPGGGSFVVGDKSASGSVTFWGAQWSKTNSLSGGAAPDAFKGFALNPSVPQCGGTWSTDPGNSSPPPAGPLPAYMAVIVTSSSSKSGATISGNTVAIVIVQTNAGYKNDPGHAGTGTVVATLCQGGTAPPPPPPTIDCKAKGTQCESLLADPAVTGRTLTLAYMDDSAIKSATATANGQSLPVAITPTSGNPQNYVDSNGGSKSTKNQSLLTITLPAAGTYSVVVTAYDGDGDLDQYVWTVTVP